MNIRKFKDITLNLKNIENSQTGFRTGKEMLNLDVKAIVSDFSGISFALDNERRIISANNRFCEYLNSSPSEVEGKLIASLNLALDPQKLFLQETLRTGKPTYGYRDNLFEEYDYQLIYCNLPVNLDTGGIGVLVLGIEVIADADFNDIKILNFNTSSEITDVWIVDNEYHYIDVTDPYGKFKVVDSELIGKKVTEVLPDDYDPLLTEAMDQKKLLESKRILRSGDDTFHLNVISFPLMVEDELVGGVDILIDLDSKTKLVNQAQKANEIKNAGEMAFRIIHELRNPLQVVKSSAEVGGLLARKDNFQIEKLELYFNKINEQVGELNTLLGQLLEFCQCDKPTFERLELKEILLDVENFLRKFCPKYGIEFETDFEGDLSIIYGDKELLKRALINIVENAIESLENHEKERKIKVKAWDTNGEILISIYNSGPNISEDIQETIFDPFTSTKGKNGSGLGLPVTYHIIHNLHQGNISFQTEENKGTIFYVTLPY
ncbi:ATP-binding protein [Selenihalanaerobacter shriftii]|uniref:histidine kinase n=1 Tax=Selenihalanaerobacter shriftii TaxID=142842 RepID=A0A1T4LAK3_9FIRM|nr:ATP-binding protein [Selenihalanaerobacter shriftii]SJZ51624.1 Signal transduction histidine kinase [Selenihalanaerobacter shriftii]